MQKAPVLREWQVLPSKSSPRDNDVTIVTQCSIDRLHHLEEQARCWSSAISAAVYVPQPSKTILQQLRHVHARTEQTTESQLSMILATDQHFQSSNGNRRIYPINALRNMALLHARTEVVLLLDVDFLPFIDLCKALTLNSDIHQSIVRSCCIDRTAYVFPAFEPIAQAGSIEEGATIAKESAAGGKAVVAQKLSAGQLSPFAFSVFPQGHESTNYEKWLNSVTSYTVDYKEEFEPYILCSRRLIPWYDERFTGYGKNKIIHIYHLACMGFRFIVHPNWYVVSLLHPPSQSWREALGPDRISGLFHKTKLLYENAKIEIRNGMTPDMGRTTLISVKDQVPCCLGEWYRRDIPRRPNDFPMQYLRSICELRLMYHRRTLASTMTLLSPHRPEENDVTLVTTCTPDRLNRLECVVEAWDGPVCVAIYYRRRIGCKFTSCMHLKSKLKMWHSAFCKQNKIVDISLLVDEQQHLQHIVPMEPITSVDQAHDCSMDTLLWKKYRGKEKRVPINSMRNSALELASTDLAFLLDVDLVPCAGLHATLQSIIQSMGNELKNTALVVPAFEIKFEQPSNEDGAFLTAVGPSIRTETISQDEARRMYEKCPVSQLTIPLVHSVQPLTDNVKQKNWVKQMMNSMKHKLAKNCASIPKFSLITSIAHGGLDSLLPLIDTGKAILFHSESYPTGHCPTNVSKWLERTRENGECYPIDYIEGYEPFVVISKKSIPKFEAKFSGYGYDKVSFCLNLHMMGFSFHVIPGMFTIDIPHKRSQDWKAAFGPNAQKLQAAMIQGLYSRFRRQLALKFSSWPCQVESGQKLLSGSLLVSQLPQMKPDLPLKQRSRIWCGGFDAEAHFMLSGTQVDETSIPWSALGWKLSAKQGLNNCKLTSETIGMKSPKIGDDAWHKAILTVFLPSGTWSPSGCRSCGIPIGGVAARHCLARGLSGAVLRYKVRFEQSFCWALGGALPGLYCNKGQGFRVNMGWRSNGLGTVMVTNKGQTTPLEMKSQLKSVGTSTSGLGPNTSQWFFVKGQWHSLQILLSFAEPRTKTTDVCVPNGCDHHYSTGEAKIWLDDQLVHDKEYHVSPRVDTSQDNAMNGPGYGFVSCANNRPAGDNRIDGVLLTCFYGGSTQEWAAPHDTYVHFSDFEIWASDTEQHPSSCLSYEMN